MFAREMIHGNLTARRRVGRAFSIAILFLGTTAASGRSFDHEHRIFGSVLDRFVADSRVDYRALAADPGELRRYLRGLGAVARAELEAWSRADQIAFLTNLYNAATLDLIIRHYPVGSIKDIGGFLSGPWKQEIVGLFGDTTTLDHVEHGILRAKYDEPRIHFALVCAAKGCPPLRDEPFVGTRLDEQLDEQGRRFLGNTEKNRVDRENRQLHLSPIFKWFRKDFEKGSASVVEFVRPYFSETDRQALDSSFDVEYTHYDWSLNEG